MSEPNQESPSQLPEPGNRNNLPEQIQRLIERLISTRPALVDAVMPLSDPIVPRIRSRPASEQRRLTIDVALEQQRLLTLRLQSLDVRADQLAVAVEAVGPANLSLAESAHFRQQVMAIRLEQEAYARHIAIIQDQLWGQQRGYAGCACEGCRRSSQPPPLFPDGFAFTPPAWPTDPNPPTWAIGDKNCVYNAHDRHLRCAVNPTGDCNECSHFRDRRTEGETPTKRVS